MGNQAIIIGATGTASPDLVAEIVALLTAKGLQVRHASRTYNGSTEFAVGGTADLLPDLEAVVHHSLSQPGKDTDLILEAISKVPAAVAELLSPNKTQPAHGVSIMDFDPEKKEGPDGLDGPVGNEGVSGSPGVPTEEKQKNEGGEG